MGLILVMLSHDGNVTGNIITVHMHIMEVSRVNNILLLLLTLAMTYENNYNLIIIHYSN